MPAGIGFGLMSMPTFFRSAWMASHVVDTALGVGGLKAERELDRLAIAGAGADAIGALRIAGRIQQRVGLIGIIRIRGQAGVVPVGVRPQRGDEGLLVLLQVVLDEGQAVDAQSMMALRTFDVLERAEAVHIALAFAVDAGGRAQVEEQVLELRRGIDAQLNALRLQRLDGLDIGLGQVRPSGPRRRS